MKKVFKNFIAVLLVCFIFSSCKKSADPMPTDPGYVGLWKGKYGNGATTYPVNGYAFLFRNNGTVRVFNNSDTSAATKAEGTYSITGGTINTTYTYLGTTQQYSTTSNIDPKYTFQEGTWGSGTNTSNGGNYFIVKQ